MATSDITVRDTVAKLTPDNAVAQAACALGQNDVLLVYISMLHRIIAVLVILIFCFGLGIVWGDVKLQARVNEVRVQQGEITKLQAENVNLTAIAAPMLEKIKRGANYISSNYKVPEAKALHYAELIMVSALKTDTAYSLALTLVGKECSYNCTVSFNGSSYGMTQVNCYYHCAAYKVTKQDLLKPEVAIPIGFDILANYRKRWKSTFTALERYSGHESAEYNRLYAEDMLRQEQYTRRFLERPV